MNKPFKTVIVHIGLGKTGSSAIQKYLHENAGWLSSAHGIYYPDFSTVDKKFQGNHSRYMRVLFGSSEEKTGIFSMAKYDTAANKSEYTERVETCLSTGCSQAVDDTMLLSAEGVGHLCMPSIVRLRNWLTELTDDIRLVACVRHPVNALASEIQQRLKTGQILEDMYQSPPHYAFKDFFSRFIELFGRDSISLYDFGEAVSHPGGVEAAFLQQVGICEPFPEQQGENNNPRMSQDAALLMSALNRVEPVIVAGKRNPKRSNAFLNYIQSMPGEKYRVPCSVVAEFSSVMEPHIEWLENQLDFSPDLLPMDCDDTDYSGTQLAVDKRARRLASYYHTREKLIFYWYRLTRDPRQSVYLTYR